MSYLSFPFSMTSSLIPCNLFPTIRSPTPKSHVYSLKTFKKIPQKIPNLDSTKTLIHYKHKKKKKKNAHTIAFASSHFIPRFSISMESSTQKNVYSVWALPPEDVTSRLKKLMEGLRSEFGGPQFEPHVTVVGAISLTDEEARDKFKKACEGLKAYDVSVEKVDTGTFFYQCVYLLLHPAPQVVETSDHCCNHFGYEHPTTYMPHLSLLYADLTDEEKKKAQEKAYNLDESIGSLSFQVSRLALYKTDTEDKSLKSWEKVAEFNLN